MSSSKRGAPRIGVRRVRPARAFYTDMDDELRVAVQARALARLAFGSFQASWMPDEVLAQELAERAMEVGLLVRELETLQLDQPATRRAEIDNAAAIRVAGLVEAAQQARTEVTDLARLHGQQVLGRDRLAAELEATPILRRGARGDLRERIELADATLAEIGAQLEIARAAADSAGQFTGVRPDQWAAALSAADPWHCRARLRSAQESEERQILQSLGYLVHLQRELAQCQVERRRRDQLVETQRLLDERKQQAKAAELARLERSPRWWFRP
ncbi:hypothetical protein ACFWPK_31975 [Nocardia sp. NPDC058519]|uniref:hypothetical protein n=1 Tax=Nocardia sp. NPDC058519 TaxID=3346535 RepID=UPI003652D05B